MSDTENESNESEAQETETQTETSVETPGGVTVEETVTEGPQPETSETDHEVGPSEPASGE